jgi:hypothetical protein
MADIPFNRIVVPSEGGVSGKRFAEFLNIDPDSELSLSEMQSYLYDRLFRLGMIRHVDGDRAYRKRKSSREAAKRRRAHTAVTKPKQKAKAKGRKRATRARARAR